MPAEHLAARRIAEVDVVEPDGQGAVRERHGSRALGERLDPVEPGEAPRRGRGRPLAEVDDPTERLERPDELQEQRHEERELADREIPCDRLAAADQQHGGDPERGEEDEPGEKATLDGRLTHRLVAHRVGALAEAVANVVLAPERLHHLDPDDRLVRGLGEVTLLALHLARDRKHAVREEVLQASRSAASTTAAVSASLGFTTVSTIAAPTSMSTLWIAWTTPQPMKYRTG